MDCSGVRVFTVELLWTVFQQLLPSPSPPHPPPRPCLLFSGQLLTVCKCGFDTMAPVERTKWMKSTWDCTLSHGCVYWASGLTKNGLLWCPCLHCGASLDSFSTAVAISLPTPPPLPLAHPPPQYAGPKLVCIYGLKSSR